MSRESEMRRCAILTAQAQSERRERERRWSVRTPCSFCHADGFVGTNVCQNCGGSGLVVDDAWELTTQWLASDEPTSVRVVSVKWAGTGRRSGRVIGPPR